MLGLHRLRYLAHGEDGCGRAAVEIKNSPSTADTSPTTVTTASILDGRALRKQNTLVQEACCVCVERGREMGIRFGRDLHRGAGS